MGAEQLGPTLNRLIERVASQQPDAPCVRCGSETASYARIDRMGEVLAEALTARGVRPGDRVALYQVKSIETVAAIIGIAKAGAAYVPIDPLAPPERARFIIEHSGASILFSNGRTLQALKKQHDGSPFLSALFTTEPEAAVTFAKEVVALEALLQSAPEAPKRSPVAQLDTDLAYVLYTSGSTGMPKGVAITHAQSLTFVRTATEIFQLTPRDVLAAHAPFSFDLSVIDLFCAFAAGASTVIVPEAFVPFPPKIADLIEKARITVWNSVPSALVQLVKHGKLEGRDLSSLRLIMFAGEPFPLRPLRELRALVPRAELLNVYGQTEANSSTYHPVRTIPAEDGAPLPVGKAFPNYRVLVVDDAGREVRDPGVEGELFVCGGAVASGYWNDPERTAKAFVQHPLFNGARNIVYKTGDRVRYDANGDLIFIGRVDNVVKCRGFRVELGEVEGAAQRLAEVGACAVVAIPHPEHGNRLALFYVGAVAEADLRKHLSTLLPHYMLPEVIERRSSLPETATGKVDRKQLKPDAEAKLAALARV